MPSSNLIYANAISADEWTYVTPPAPTEETVRKQAGKVVLFKLTGEASATAEQIAATQIPTSGKVLVPLSVWLARKPELLDRLAKGELGVWLDTHERVETLVASETDLNIFPLIGLHVERSADGRIFSIATLLRTRHGFNNELRAFGDVTRDQLYYLKRCGFDSYLIRADRSAEAAISGLQDFSAPYQGAVDDQLPVWRRFDRSAL